MWLLLTSLWLAHAADPDPRRTPIVIAVERTAPAVVAITTRAPNNDPFAAFWGNQTRSGEGSGVVIDEDGIVLTNAHVVEGAHAITATFPDGRTVDATVLGIAPELDLAVLRLPGDGFAAVPIGSSAGLLLGEPVIAIGNPLGLGHTVTTGVVSAVHRSLETDRRVYQDFIQTDASINPGNSGGPLLDINGRLIGVNTAIRRDGQNIGFAIPVDRAIKVAKDLVTFGTVRIPWLGVDLADVSLRDGAVRPRVERVWAGSGAVAAGVRPGDLVVDVNGRAVQGRADLNAFLAGVDVGAPVRLSVLRDGRPTPVTIAGTAVPTAVVDAVLRDQLGVEVQGTDGTFVQAVVSGGQFQRAGLQVGDRIVAVNGTEVIGAAAFRDALLKAKGEHRDRALLTIRRGVAVAQMQFAI
jgi:serine protease Do